MNISFFFFYKILIYTKPCILLHITEISTKRMIDFRNSNNFTEKNNFIFKLYVLQLSFIFLYYNGNNNNRVSNFENGRIAKQ